MSKPKRKPRPPKLRGGSRMSEKGYKAIQIFVHPQLALSIDDFAERHKLWTRTAVVSFFVEHGLRTGAVPTAMPVKRFGGMKGPNQ